MTDTIALLARHLWPGRHNTGLASALGVFVPTAKSWISGTRRMPAERMRELLNFLRYHAGIVSSLGSDLEYHIRREDRRFKPRRGFFVIKDWDGTGIRTNRQWRGGVQKLVCNVGLNRDSFEVRGPVAESSANAGGFSGSGNCSSHLSAVSHSKVDFRRSLSL